MTRLPDELVIKLLLALGDSAAIVNLAATCCDYARVARDDRVEHQLKRRWRTGWTTHDIYFQRLPGAIVDGIVLRWPSEQCLWSHRRYASGAREGIQIEWNVRGGGLEWIGLYQNDVCWSRHGYYPDGTPGPNSHDPWSFWITQNCFARWTRSPTS